MEETKNLFLLLVQGSDQHRLNEAGQLAISAVEMMHVRALILDFSDARGLLCSSRNDLILECPDSFPTDWKALFSERIGQGWEALFVNLPADTDDGIMRDLMGSAHEVLWKDGPAIFVLHNRDYKELQA